MKNFQDYLEIAGRSRLDQIVKHDVKRSKEREVELDEMGYLTAGYLWQFTGAQELTPPGKEEKYFTQTKNFYDAPKILRRYKIAEKLGYEDVKSDEMQDFLDSVARYNPDFDEDPPKNQKNLLRRIGKL